MSGRRSRAPGAWRALMVCAVVAAPGAFAQEETAPPRATASSEPLVLSIEGAMERAQGASEPLQIARAGLVRADADRYRALSDWLPQIYGSGGYDRTIASEFDFFLEQAAAAPPPAEGGASATDDFASLPFGRRNIWRFGASLSQNLFAGGRSLALREMAIASRHTAQLNVSSARATVVLSVAEAYFDAVLSEQLFRIAEATAERTKQTYEQTRLGKRVGSQPEFELLRSKVAYENQQPQVVARRTQRDLAVMRLRQLLDLPPNQPVSLSTGLEAESLGGLSLSARRLVGISGSEKEPEHIEEARVSPRVSQRLAKEVVDTSSANVTLARSVRFPSLSFNSTYGRVSYPADLLPNGPDWRTNWTVGVALQVPIFTGFKITGDVMSAKASLLEAEARRRQTDELTSLDTERRVKELEAADSTWKATAGTVQQAKRAYEIAELRYREGVSTQLELSDSRILLQQAEANRAQAARDLQVARIRMALLPALPLDTGMGAGGMSGGGGSIGVPSGAAGASSGGAMIPAAGASGAQGAGGTAPSPAQPGTGYSGSSTSGTDYQ